MREVPLGAQKQFLGSEHCYVTTVPQSGRRESQTTLNALWAKIICIFTPRCPSYNKTPEYSSPPQFQWPLLSSQALEMGPHDVLTALDSCVDHETAAFLGGRLCRSHSSYYSRGRC